MTSPNELSFLPDDYLDRRRGRRTNAICAALFAVVITAICLTFRYSEKQTRTVDAAYTAKLEQFKAQAKRIEQAERMQEKQRKMARQAELAASLLEKVPRSFILAEITNAMPPGVSLVDFSLESKQRNAVAAMPPGMTAFEKKKAAEAQKAAASDVKVYDVNMKLIGLAPTDVQVAAFISKLSQCGLLKDVNLVITDQFTKDGEQLRKFQVECMLDPRAAVTPDGANTTATVDTSPK